jgi:hypothetical protein
MIIDCSKCEFFETEACNDCLVTAILHPKDEPLDIEEEEQSAIATLQQAGLAPVLKFKRKAG